MSDADVAYRIAEERIERARAENLPFLCLSPVGLEDYGVTWESDKRLRHLREPPRGITSLTWLKRLDIDSTEVADISSLVNLSNIEALDLGNTRVRDVSPLADLGAIQSLWLNDTKVSDISALARMEAMQTLWLNDSNVADLSPVVRMQDMRTLQLSDTQIVDISPVIGMIELWWLDVSHTHADLTALTAKGAAWEADDLGLVVLRFRDTPLTTPSAPLAALYEADLTDEERSTRALAILRDIRSRTPRPSPPAPNRPFVFLSYAKVDAARAAALRQALEADGVTVWQDVDLAVGDLFRTVIAERLDAAGAVLTLWSEAGVQSKFVQAEAQKGLDAGTFVHALLEDASIPLPFDELQHADLRGWAGDRDAPEYGRLLFALREKLTPGAEVGAKLDDSGRIRPAQKPVGVAPADPDGADRERAIRAQVGRIDLFLDEIGHETNADARLDRRLKRYRVLLTGDDPLWEEVDDAFASARPHMRDEELDDGLIEIAARLRAGHDDLERRMRPEQPADKREIEPPEVDPGDDGAAAAGAIGAAADALANAPGVADPSSGAFLRRLKTELEETSGEDDAPLDEKGKAARRRRTGRRVLTAAGFIAAVGSLASAGSFALTPEVTNLLAQLGDAFVRLSRILFG